MPSTSTSSAPKAPAALSWPLGSGQTRLLFGTGKIAAGGDVVMSGEYGRAPRFLNLTTGAISKLSDELPPNFAQADFIEVSVDADGTMVAFDTSYVTDSNSSRRIMVFNRKSKELTELGPVALPQISADGRNILYSAGLAALGSRGTLQRYNARLPKFEPETVVTGPDGSAPKQKTYWSYPSFNGRQVLFDNGFANTSYSVFLRDLDTNTTIEMASDAQALALSGDGSTALVSQRFPGDLRRSMLSIVNPPLPLWKRYPVAVLRPDGQPVNSNLAAISFDARSYVFVNTDLPTGPPIRQGDPFVPAEVDQKQILHYAVATKTFTEVKLEAAVVGELAAVTQISGASDLRTLYICADIFDVVSLTETPTTTRYQPLVKGRPVTNRCFVHRR
jgi:hypothetical protein